MLNFNTLLYKKNFKIQNGQFYEICGSYLGYEINKYSFGGNEYKITGDYSAVDYSLNTDAYNDWYIYKGYSPVLKLRHLGGKNWDIY